MNSLKRPWDARDTTLGLDPFLAAFGSRREPDTHSPVNSTSTGFAKLDDNASAASRQKSCNACVRGKRRCDKRTPQCTRCSTKGLDCVYQKLPPGAAVSDASCSAGASTNNMPSSSSAGESATPPLVSSTCGSSSLSADTSASASARSTATAGTTSTTCGGAMPPVTSSSATTASSCVSDVPDFDMSFDMDSLGTGTDASPESLQPDVGVPLGSGAQGHSGLDFSIVDFMAQELGHNEHDIWNLQSFATETTDKLSIPPVPAALAAAMAPPTMHQQLQLQPMRDTSLLKDCENICLEIDPLSVHDPNTRIGYVINFLTTMHSTFAQTRALPFMHTRLWTSQLPKTILTVFSASVAYAASSPSNKGWTVKLLIDAAREIHREGERAVTHADKLARVQALLILNSIRIFDGDIGLRAAAERETTVMMSWLKDLELVRDEIQLDLGWHGVNNSNIREKPPKTWENWIFIESTRRTILTSFAITCLSYMLKSEIPDETLWCVDNTFTASRHLWDASSSVDFFRAWREKPQFAITDMNFKEFWVYARPADCDDFTRIMLTSQVGIDTMAHFLNGDISIPANPGKVP